MAEDDLEDQDDGSPPPDNTSDAKPWLKLISRYEKAFQSYHDRCDNIDKLFANLDRLSSPGRDRQMSLFWANMQTMGPSVYSRPPVPVVVPRFKDGRPVPRTASELLERSSVVSIETDDIDATMTLVRDDLVRLARGAMWVRYEAASKSEGNLSQKMHYEFKFREDFAHDPARSWKEVDWVAAAAYLTRKEMRKRFYKKSGDEYKSAAYSVRKDDVNDNFDTSQKAKVWELWSKSKNKVVWVTEGCEKVLDEDKPHLDLEGFFPCPRPAYGTVQPRTLIPVPDVLQYRDQLEEINELTARIAALTDAVQVRGFYPAGAGEISDAVEAAIKTRLDNQVLIPISNWAMLGGGAVKDMIVWLPIEMVVNTIEQLVTLRQQLIQDVYEISGISDILRGQTDPNETLGAQELKAQTGSTRIKDKQAQIVRLARDAVRIAAEVMAEDFSPQTLLDMSQMEIPTDADIVKQAKDLQTQKAGIEKQLAEAQQDPEIQQMAQAQPDKAKAVMEQAQQQVQGIDAQLQKLSQTVTIERVMKLLRDQKLRPFVLDIETDSTIAPDENAQKQRATEYITAMTGLFAQAIPAVQQVPQSAPLVADIIKFANSQFRVGREFEQTVEEFTDQMKQVASTPHNQGPSPEQMKAQADAQAVTVSAQADAQRAAAEAQKAGTEAQTAQVENAERAQALHTKHADEEQARRIKDQEANDASAQRQADLAEKQKMSDMQRVQAAEKHAQEMELGRLNIVLLNTKIDQSKVQTDNSIKTTEAGVEARKASAKNTEAPAQ